MHHRQHGDKFPCLLSEVYINVNYKEKKKLTVGLPSLTESLRAETATVMTTVSACGDNAAFAS